MLFAEARVETEHASQYLVRLCRHVSKAAEAHQQMPAAADWADEHCVISLGSGRCTLRADGRVLTMRAEAPDVQSLDELQRRIGDRVELFGRREGLKVIW